ncbi:unnamed protein product [Periconia digitata]|uniref:Uncharacterized protein n=1 Tax=Periconia digitata TaxID=1303443 RepID=A0A9W4UC48_9PLEO|nr:unnamed protein product [Periconia digitata]
MQSFVVSWYAPYRVAFNYLIIIDGRTLSTLKYDQSGSLYAVFRREEGMEGFSK